MFTTLTRQTAAATLAVLMALPAPAFAAVTTRDDTTANPRGWSAVADMDPRALREMARTLPLSENATGDQPWCGHDAEIESSLAHDFGEQKVATNALDTALWGSAVMGTWTMVLERPDQTSCIIASGVGFSPDANPLAFFTKANLAS